MLRKIKFSNLLFGLLWLVLLAVESVTLVKIWQLDILPGKYFSLLTALLLLVLLVAALLLIAGSRGKLFGNTLRTIAAVLSVVTIAGCLLLVILVGDLFDRLNHVTDPVPNGVSMEVYVQKDDPAQNLSDAEDYTFGVVSGYETEKTQVVLDELQSVFGKAPLVEEFTTVPEMVDALLSGKIQAVVLNSGYLDILEATEGYADFGQKVRTLHEVIVQEPTQPTDDTEPTEPHELQVYERPFVMYLSGSDTRYDNLVKNTRSDVNILMVVNPVAKQILMINTPRDTFVPNPAGGGVKDKLTHCGIYGISNSVKSLSDFYGVKIDYYAQINFNGFETLIDAIGGVTVISEKAFWAGDKWIEEGENYLDGEDALMFARDRHHAGGDKARGQNQMRLMQAVIRKLTSSTAMITNYGGIMDSLEGMFVTDMGTADISGLMKMQLEDMAAWDMYSYAISGDGASDITYSMPGQYVYVMYPNEEHVQRATTLVNRVLNGEILTSEDVA